MVETYHIEIAGRVYDVNLNFDQTIVNGKVITPEHVEFDGHILRYRSQNSLRTVVLDRSEEQAYLMMNGREVPVMIETSRDRLLRLAESASVSGVHHAEIKAAMPGLVVRINKQVGDPVKKGDPVLILEAMKMENEVRAPIDGVISEIRAKERGSVEKGDILIVFE
ncbi:acetyl-CoA carboxylase biotin carboxyl carrier protein subunit [bacterium]|nr:acetyl-CoA carboxylase biotin carboxyl carrier protein subunit [bacterium]